MRLIILAAGQSLSLDGMIKSLVRNPATGLPLLEHACKAFSFCDITVVVGYKAVEIMQAFPHLQFVYNSEWAVTNNAYSLGLALDDTPTYVMSGDLLFSKTLIERMQQGEENIALASHRENRALSAINCVLHDRQVTETYVGPLRTPQDPEAVGIFKITDTGLLKEWKMRCLKHGNLFVGQTLPFDSYFPPIFAHNMAENEQLFEINTTLDYLRLIEQLREVPCDWS